MSKVTQLINGKARNSRSSPQGLTCRASWGLGSVEGGGGVLVPAQEVALPTAGTGIWKMQLLLPSQQQQHGSVQTTQSPEHSGT